MSKKWEPVAHRIIVKPDPIEKTTASGIRIVMDERLEKNAQQTGVIVEIGEDSWVAFKTKRPYAGLKVGDRVAYAKYAGKWLKAPSGDPEEDLVVLIDEDIVAKEVNDDVDAEKA